MDQCPLMMNTVENLDVRLKNNVDLDVWGSFFLQMSQTIGSQLMILIVYISNGEYLQVSTTLEFIDAQLSSRLLIFLVLFVLEGLARRALAPDFRKLQLYLAVLLEKEVEAIIQST